MLKSYAFVLLTFSMMLSFNSNSFAKKKKILIFSKTAGFHHSSIPAGIMAIQRLAMENKFIADSTTDATKINTANLKQYAAVVFLNTTGDIFNEQQEKAFEQYIRSGGGFVGVHAATDTEYGWPWFGKLSGAYFVKHPAQQVAELNVLNRNTISTKHLPEVWKRKDEWYNFKDISPDLKVLISINENSYTGGSNGANHPMAWYHDFEGGRSFYTGLGHTEESYTDPLFLQHLLGGIQYAMGVKRMER
ncbi:Crp/Fnr family transcriptional regulator [Pedobacter sp. KBW06]|uniref:ThuA domain-containing protein n=1 Tax=Pedobacter sp. KBW06 TaxID=2153359 RepID=UPI000F59B4C9|nr:ThuA domain-containing protein [Pedobacter sp. KBW06]RQO71941.1 Crp/Fnr family transcriptional regulator [Pedobacter sp. KBW06]